MIFKPYTIAWHLKKGISLKSGLVIDGDKTVSAKEELGVKSDDNSAFEAQAETLQPAVVLADGVKVPDGNLIKAEASDVAAVMIKRSQQLQSLEPPAKADAQLSANAVEDLPLANMNSQNIPYRLRLKRADVFVDSDSKVAFLGALLNFLKQKNFLIRDYDASVHYLPSDVLLLGGARRVSEGIVIDLDSGKKEVWLRLKAEFPEKLA